ncbi:dipeptidyl aminopeptidase [Purpureocillium lavendulum]|uniref:Dipeptidyl aminopeptidase n=1 Tax=Purpureocillium lavendulum TaxID=1247861 RepID=A0AB34G1H2_9HYPO|nr:dipeptidyl aminopeptidase [Purpureocillium lavendulum]
MDTVYELPFFAPESRLPAPIPSTADIDRLGEVLLEYSGRRVVRFGSHFVVKYGLDVSLTEGENMLFVRRQIQAVSTPEVFALFSVQDADGQQQVNYIVMGNVIGDRLDAIWPSLGSPQKERIARQLRLQIDALRTLPSPGYFGCIGRRPFEDSMFWTAPESDRHDGTISGPFETESELNDAFIKKYLYNSGLEHKAAFYRRVLPVVLRGHGIVFTHGDFQRKNVILKEHGELVIVDWENAGWYPAYWEYALAMFACGSWKDDWHEYLAQILTEYPNEYDWFDMLRRELWS